MQNNSIYILRLWQSLRTPWAARLMDYLSLTSYNKRLAKIFAAALQGLKYNGESFEEDKRVFWWSRGQEPLASNEVLFFF
jgi:hypothetical protein